MAPDAAADILTDIIISTHKTLIGHEPKALLLEFSLPVPDGFSGTAYAKLLIYDPSPIVNGVYTKVGGRCIRTEDLEQPLGDLLLQNLAVPKVGKDFVTKEGKWHLSSRNYKNALLEALSTMDEAKLIRRNGSWYTIVDADENLSKELWEARNNGPIDSPLSTKDLEAVKSSEEEDVPANFDTVDQQEKM